MTTHLQELTFYHGTHYFNVESIVKDGFKTWQILEADEGDDFDTIRYAAQGCLGRGIYLTRNWKNALFFGNTLLKTKLKPNTKLVDVSIPPNTAVIKYLKKKFGKDILTRPPWKVIPKNKKLKLSETIELVRYLFERSFVKKKVFSDWKNLEERDWYLLRSYRSMLIRHGFCGYGNPTDELGIVIFSDDRVVLTELVGHLPCLRGCDDELSLKKNNIKTLDQVRKKFHREGNTEMLALANKIKELNKNSI
jgi:hypothetical protein